MGSIGNYGKYTKEKNTNSSLNWDVLYSAAFQSIDCVYYPDLMELSLVQKSCAKGKAMNNRMKTHADRRS